MRSATYVQRRCRRTRRAAAFGVSGGGWVSRPPAGAPALAAGGDASGERARAGGGATRPRGGADGDRDVVEREAVVGGGRHALGRELVGRVADDERLALDLVEPALAIHAGEDLPLHRVLRRRRGAGRQRQVRLARPDLGGVGVLLGVELDLAPDLAGVEVPVGVAVALLDQVLAGPGEDRKSVV